MSSFIEGLFYSFLIGGGIGILVGLYYVYVYYKYNEDFLKEIEKRKSKNIRKYTFLWYLHNYYKLIIKKLLSNNTTIKIKLMKIKKYILNSFIFSLIYRIYFLFQKILIWFLKYLKNVFID